MAHNLERNAPIVQLDSDAYTVHYEPLLWPEHPSLRSKDCANEHLLINSAWYHS